jgi:DNA-binding transcriptional LysR family regulator
LHRLGDNLIDLAIMVRPPEDMHTVNEPFATQPYIIVAPPDHPLAREKSIALATLAREPFVVREEDSDTWQSMEESFGTWLPQLKVAMKVKSNETIKQAVIAGIGIAFVSVYMVTLERQVGKLVVLDVKGFPLIRNWYVVHRAKKRLPPVAAAFERFLIDEGAALIDGMAQVENERRLKPRASARKIRVKK